MNTAVKVQDNTDIAIPTPCNGIGKIAAAISAVMNEIGVIAKEGTNQFHRYRYVQMQDVLQHLTPLLAKNGLVIIQTEVGRAMFDEDRAVSVQYQFTIAHTSGEIWPDRPLQTGLSRCRDSKGGFDDKALNKCHTAARKYFLLALFQIPTGDEDDADSGANDQSPKQTASPIQPKTVAPPSDPETGEFTPHEIRLSDPPDWTSFGQSIIAACNGGKPIEIDNWLTLNADNLMRMLKDAPKVHRRIMDAVNKIRP